MTDPFRWGAAGLPRRRFLQGAAAAAVAGHPLVTLANAAAGKAELVVRVGRMYTMDPTNAGAEAIAVRGGRILAVGAWDDVRAFVGPRTRTLDARAYTMTPGFIDSHAHLRYTYAAYGVNMNVRSIERVKQRLAQQADKQPEGTLVTGYMYDDTKFEEGRPLTRDDIDAVVDRHPVIVRHRGGHTSVFNSRAFQMAGIGEDVADPFGGRFFRENGRLTGKVAEKARALVMEPLEARGVVPEVDRDTRRRALIALTNEMAATGLTGTTDASSGRDLWIAATDAMERNALLVRLGLMPRIGRDLYPICKDMGMRSGFGNERLRIIAAKFGADGSASERTMAMSEPYEGTDDHGILTATQEEIDAAVDDAVAHGLRIGIHANGDVAIDMVLKAYERVLADWQGVNPRLRIEHCSLVNDDLLRRIRDTGSIPTLFYTYAHYHGNKWVDYGPERMEWMFAHRSFLDWGIPVAPASDYMPGPYEPMMALQSMVTRKDMQGRVWGPSQRISVEEALRVCTVNGAYASFEEDLKGSLTPGKLADFVLLEKDPAQVDPDALQEIRIVSTWMGGKATYES